MNKHNNPDAKLITVTTDLVIATINTQGGYIERLELRQEPVSVDQPDQGFPLINNQAESRLVVQDGLLVNEQNGPTHSGATYLTEKTNYQLNSDQEQIVVPLSWVSDNGVSYLKTFTFKRDSYVLDINYQINNTTNADWNGYFYGQFSSVETKKKGGGFGQLPSFLGAASYTPEEKYKKWSFGDMRDKNLESKVDQGWIAMLQHYFVGAWIPKNGDEKQLYSSVDKNAANPLYRVGYNSLKPTTLKSGETGNVAAQVYLGSKEQARLRKLEKENGIDGLALTVDYGMLTFIADPLFTLLTWIQKVVKNWGWSIIILTILIKLAFYPLSAASYRSMAAMKKLQPRMQTLKERYKDDRQKFQVEMMAMYKKEKINPAGGCLPILIQIPVFIALYWVLLESVEMRQAPFALWLQDLSSKDPYYILPVLMGLSMFLQQKLNPAPMDDIQKKVMTIMPIALTFLFATFPQGLVLYWVVNNVLSIAQQWWINKQHGVKE